MHSSLPYLLTAFHDSIDGVAAPLIHFFMNSSKSFTRFHRNDGPFRRSWLLREGIDADWAEVSTMSCAGRLSIVEAFEFRWRK